MIDLVNKVLCTALKSATNNFRLKLLADNAENITINTNIQDNYFKDYLP